MVLQSEAYVTKAVPLCSLCRVSGVSVQFMSIRLAYTLRVEGIEIIIGQVLEEHLDLMFEDLAAKSWYGRHVERQTGTNQQLAP